MGDSYISGEAGRWQGNSDSTSGSRDGTDRSWTGSSADPSTIYGTTYASGCDRSDTAEVNSATGITQNRINLACSGATTADIFRAANGGQTYKGEAPQADQLAAVAARNDVKLITLSIGGNDLGFADVITACAKDYLIWYSYCHTDQQAAIDAKMDAAMAGVGKSIDEIRAVMSADGYAAGSYRIVLQSYPSPIPRSTENRYSESGWDRASIGGCPFWDADADWARDSMVPQIANRLAGVAADRGCSSSTCATCSRAARSAPPPPRWPRPAPRRPQRPASGPASSTPDSRPARAPCRSRCTPTPTASSPSAAA